MSAAPQKAYTVFPARLLTMALVLTGIVLIMLVWFTLGSYRNVTRWHWRNLRIEELSGKIVHLNEVLGMTARMAAASTDLNWERRYREVDPQLHAALAESIRLTRDLGSSEAAEQTAAAHRGLEALENRSFALIRAGDAGQARSLFGDEYAALKLNYAAGVQRLVAQMREQITANQRSKESEATFSVLVIALCILLLFLTWLAILAKLRRLHRQLFESNETLELNIEEQTRSRQELQWKTAFLEAQVNSSPDGVLVVNASGKRILQNGRFGQLLDIPEHIARGENDAEQVRCVAERVCDPEAFLQRVEHLYAHPNETGRDVVTLKNGSILDRYSAPVIGQDGVSYGRIWKFRDVTESRRADEAIRFQAHMLDSIGQAVIATDLAGRITYANRFGEELYDGGSSSELPGKPLLEMTIPELTGEAGERILANLQRGESWSGETLVRRRDGTQFSASATTTPLRDQAGRVTGMVGIFEDNTERERAAAELRRREAEQRQLAEQLEREKARLVAAQAVAKIGSWETNAVTEVITWSEETYRIFGTEAGAQENTLADFLRLVHPDDRALVASAYERSFAHATPDVLEHRLLLADGQIKCVEERWQAFCDAEGQPLYALGTCQDITERKQAEQALRDAEAKYRSIFENSCEGIFQNTPDGRFLSANPALAKILGFASPEELIRERTDIQRQSYANPALRETFQRQLEEHGSVIGFEYEVLRRDGTVIWVSEHSRLVRDAAGQPLYYEGSVQEITARKRAEEELFQSRETLRGILDHIPQRVFWKDLNLVYIGCNSAFAADQGFGTISATIGKSDYDTVSSVNAELYRADDRFVIENNTPKFAFDEQGVSIQGEPVWLRTSKVPLHDSSGRVVAILGTYEDITENTLAKLENERLKADLEKRVQQRTAALFAATQEAERASRAKSEFLSRTSHELRTPMNAILGFSQLLEMEENLEPEQRQCIDQILNAGRHLLTLIDEVLDISSAESGSITIAAEPVAVDRLVLETLALVRSLGTPQQIQVELGTPLESAWKISADPQRIKQVLLNLLSNAIKYNRPGGRVFLDCRPVVVDDVPLFRFAIRDTGSGISPENLQRLFTPFDRLDAERNRTHIAGAGLGLALAKKMIELMGGRIGVESVLGEGSTFWIEMPLADADAAPRLPGVDLAPAKAAVLYIEDNDSNLRLITRILTRRPGIELVSAPTGALGLKLARARTFDLILLDLHLPDYNGDRLLAQLAADARTSAIPVVMLTADDSSGKREQILGAGARAFLAKPVEIRALLAVIDRFIEFHPEEPAD